MSSYLKNDQVHVAATTPKVHLEGTEVGASNLSIRENAGKVDIYDETTGTIVMSDILAHAARHAAGGADALSGIAAAQLATDTIKIVVPIAIPDSNQADLTAASTGVKWTSNFKVKIDPQNLKSAVIRATWTATNTDSVTAVEVYDETAAAVLGSASGNAGTNAEGAVTGFTAGNIVTVRLNVTTASATTTATTSLTYAVLELTYGAS